MNLPLVTFEPRLNCTRALHVIDPACARHFSGWTGWLTKDDSFIAGARRKTLAEAQAQGWYVAAGAANSGLALCPHCKTMIRTARQRALYRDGAHAEQEKWVAW